MYIRQSRKIAVCSARITIHPHCAELDDSLLKFSAEGKLWKLTLFQETWLPKEAVFWYISWYHADIKFVILDYSLMTGINISNFLWRLAVILTFVPFLLNQGKILLSVLQLVSCAFNLWLILIVMWRTNESFRKFSIDYADIRLIPAFGGMPNLPLQQFKNFKVKSWRTSCKHFVLRKQFLTILRGKLTIKTSHDVSTTSCHHCRKWKKFYRKLLSGFA